MLSPAQFLVNFESLEVHHSSLGATNSRQGE